MQTVVVRCPHCHAPQPEARASGQYTCAYCRHAFAVAGATAATYPAPPVPRTVTPPTPPPPIAGTRSTVPRLALALVAIPLVLCVGVAVIRSVAVSGKSALAGTNDGDEPGAGAGILPALGAGVVPSVAPSSPTVTPTSVSAAPAVVARAELRNVAEGTTMIGGKFWLADYVNVGDAPIERPSVVVSLFDAAGTRVGEQRGFAEREWLAPGASTAILVLVSSPPVYARAEMAAVGPEAAGAIDPQVGLEVLGVTERADGSSVHRKLTGTVRNGAPHPLRFPQVVAIGRSASGAPVSIANGYATSSREIPAGGESGFELSVGTFEIERPARWELFGVGSR